MSLRSHQQVLIEEVITTMNTQETAVQTLMEGHNRLADAIDALLHDRELELRGLVPKLTAEKADLRCDVEKLKEDLGCAQRELAIRKDLVESFRNNIDNLRQALQDSRQERHMLESKLEAAGAEVALLREELEKLEDRCEALNIVATDANRDRLSVTDERNVLRDKVRSLAGKLAAAEFRLVDVFEERDELKRMLAAMDSPLLKAKPGSPWPTAQQTPDAKLLEENVKLRNELNSALAEVEKLKARCGEYSAKYRAMKREVYGLRQRPTHADLANMRDKWLVASGRLAKVQAYLVGRRELYGGQQVDPQCGCDDCVFLAELDSIIALCATDSSAS